jgi:hypothetical protein
MRAKNVVNCLIIGSGEQNLKTDTFSNVNEVCPNCGQMNTYNEKSMIWREE